MHHTLATHYNPNPPHMHTHNSFQTLACVKIIDVPNLYPRVSNAVLKPKLACPPPFVFQHCVSLAPAQGFFLQQIDLLCRQ